MKKRTTTIRRKTKETNISVAVNLDGNGSIRISTGLPFLDHMLNLLSKHSLIDLTVRASGDLAVDYHHTVEDIGLCLGEALDKALGDRKGIARYGSCLVPMDEALTQAAIDLGGRPYLVYRTACRKRKILAFDLDLVKVFFAAFTVRGRLALHIGQLYGSEPHHAYESMFKAVACALRSACRLEPRMGGVPSSKGRI